MNLFSSLLASLLVVIGIPFAILAADSPQNFGPDIIKMKMGEKALNFQHRKA